jgi:hypothetical protein
MSLTGIARGQGWRSLENTAAGDLPAVVRYLLHDEAHDQWRQLGSGSIIGAVEGRWLITATAAQVFQGVPLQAHMPSPGSAGLDRRYHFEALKSLRCAVTLPERNGELLCPLGAAVISCAIDQRDTAIVCVGLPEPVGASVLPIDLGPPPAPEETVLVAGFGAPPTAAGSRAAPGAAVPARRLIVREGFYGEFGARTARLNYPLLRHLIPLEPTMVGGPVIAQREIEPGRALRTLIGINNQDVPQVHENAAAREDLAGEGFATHVLALYAQEVPLPSGVWISFLEAIKRGVVQSFGPEARRVSQRRGPNDAMQLYIEP